MDANFTIGLLSRTPSPSVLALQLEWIKCDRVGLLLLLRILTPSQVTTIMTKHKSHFKQSKIKETAHPVTPIHLHRFAFIVVRLFACSLLL